MFLPVLVILCCLFISAETAQIPVTVTELTTHVRFNGYVRSMFAHPGDGDKLIVTDEHAVWNFDPRTKSKSLIAGSSSSGYQEGIGQNARFYYPSGIASVNETVVAIVPETNNCIRLVNLITNTTEHYAGTCGASGYQDGTRSTAKFSTPVGITRVGRDFFVCDFNNNKIRKISDNVVSTVVSNIKYPTYLSSTETNLLFTFEHGVGVVDLRSSKMTTITGGSSYGLVDGSLTSARFYQPRGIVYVTETIYVVADYNNKAVRLIDTDKRTVSALNIPEIGSTYSWSVLIYNGTLLVGLGDGRILSLPLSDLPVPQSVQNLNYLCQNYSSDQTLMIPNSDFSVLFTPLGADSDIVECYKCPKARNLSLGIHEFTYTYNHKLIHTQKICRQRVTVITTTPDVKCPNDLNLTIPAGRNSQYFTLPEINVGNPRLRCESCPPSGKVLYEGEYTENIVYLDVLTNQSIECSYLIRVNKQAPPCYNETKKIFLPKQKIKTDRIKAGSCGVGFFLVPGLTEIQVDENCYHKYDVYSPVEVICPQDYTVTLSDNSNKINITIPQPRVDESRLSCINCPGSVQIFDEGFYNLTFDYLDSYFNETTSCTYMMTVIKPDTTPVCTNETVKVYLEQNQTSSKKIQIKELGAKLTLGVGDLKIELDSGCFKIFRVYEWTEMKRIVQLQTSYQIKCTSLNKLGFRSIDANLRHPTNFLKALCPECQIDGNSPVIQCVNETLTVKWRTGITSNRQWLVENEKERTTLQSSLVKFQKIYPEIDITAFVNLVPRTIAPIKDKSGLYIKVVTTAECQDNNFLYDREADVCVRTRCSSSD